MKNFDKRSPRRNRCSLWIKSDKDLVNWTQWLKRRTQASNDAFKNEINKKNDKRKKKDLKNYQHGGSKYRKPDKHGPDGKNRRKHWSPDSERWSKKERILRQI